jgi:hypothetical protein
MLKSREEDLSHLDCPEIEPTFHSENLSYDNGWSFAGVE